MRTLVNRVERIEARQPRPAQDLEPEAVLHNFLVDLRRRVADWDATKPRPKYAARWRMGLCASELEMIDAALAAITDDADLTELLTRARALPIDDGVPGDERPEHMRTWWAWTISGIDIRNFGLGWRPGQPYMAGDSGD